MRAGRRRSRRCGDVYVGSRQSVLLSLRVVWHGLLLLVPVVEPNIATGAVCV